MSSSDEMSQHANNHHYHMQQQQDHQQQQPGTLTLTRYADGTVKAMPIHLGAGSVLVATSATHPAAVVQHLQHPAEALTPTSLDLWPSSPTPILCSSSGPLKTLIRQLIVPSLNNNNKRKTTRIILSDSSACSLSSEFSASPPPPASRAFAAHEGDDDDSDSNPWPFHPQVATNHRNGLDCKQTNIWKEKNWDKTANVDRYLKTDSNILMNPIFVNKLCFLAFLKESRCNSWVWVLSYFWSRLLLVNCQSFKS